MKVSSTPKIRLFAFTLKRKKKPPGGIFTLFSVFLFFVFSSLGLSMLHLCQIYLKSNAYKKNSMLLDYACENGIKQSFHQLVNLIFQDASLKAISLEAYENLKDDASNQGCAIMEELLGQPLPLTLSESWEKLAWACETQFSFNKMESHPDYFRASYRAEVRSEGKLKNFKPKRESTLEGVLEIFAGHIPLSSVAVLMDKETSPDQKESFASKNLINLIPGEESSLPPQIQFSDGSLIPQEALSQVKKALKIDIFSPQDPSLFQLRKALGLEMTNEPVPDGVYLIHDDLGLGGVYVQGDFEEMILAIEAGFQVISFQSTQGQWILKFNPNAGQTVFQTPTDIQTFDRVPVGIIVINGKVQSLGGGILEPSGEIKLVKDKEIPSVLQGVNLTLISSDSITLTSHLIYQGVKWQEGIPYIKDPNTQLIIFATGEDIVDKSARNGQIRVGQDAPQELKIQASLTASNKGFFIEGKDKSVQLLGNLSTTDYQSNGNSLELKFDERSLQESALSENAPKTAEKVLHPFFFKITEWKDS